MQKSLRGLIGRIKEKSIADYKISSFLCALSDSLSFSRLVLAAMLIGGLLCVIFARGLWNDISILNSTLITAKKIYAIRLENLMMYEDNKQILSHVIEDELPNVKILPYTQLAEAITGINNLMSDYNLLVTEFSTSHIQSEENDIIRVSALATGLGSYDDIMQFLHGVIQTDTYYCLDILEINSEKSFMEDSLSMKLGFSIFCVKE